MHQSGFFAAHESAGAQTNEDIKVEISAENMLAQQAVFASLINGDLQALHSDGILGADIDITDAGADSVAADGHSFQHRVGVAFQNGTIHESTGVALVGVANHVLLVSLGSGGKLPLLAGGETSAATAAQTGFQHFVNHLLRGHLRQGLAQSAIAVEGDIFVDVFRVDTTAVPQSQTQLGTVEVDIFQRRVLFLVRLFLVDQMLHDTSLEQVLRNDLVHIVHLDAAVEGAFGINDDHGACFAKTEAAGADHFDFLVQTVFGDLFFKALDQLGGAAGRAARTAANKHMCAKKIHVCSSLAYPYLPSAAPMVYSVTTRPFTMCSATIRLTISGVTFT